MSFRVAVIGAGMAGLACARKLVAAGAEVVVFDKSRGPGGRVCTRRRDGLTFDHGAPLLAAAADDLPPSWQPHLRSWTPRRAHLVGGELRPLPAHAYWVAAPKMSSLSRELARGLELRLESRIRRLSPSRWGWLLEEESGERHSYFDWAVLATPAAQAERLLSHRSALRRTCEAARLLPCWVTMVESAAPSKSDYDWIDMTGGAIVRAIRDSSKPERSPGERWVLHSSPTWARERLEVSPDAIAEAMLSDLGRALPSLRARHARAHRWRYAHTLAPHERPQIVDRQARLALCGDAYREPGLLGAWACGEEAADYVLDAAAGWAKLTTTRSPSTVAS